METRQVAELNSDNTIVPITYFTCILKPHILKVNRKSEKIVYACSWLFGFKTVHVLHSRWKHFFEQWANTWLPWLISCFCFFKCLPFQTALDVTWKNNYKFLVWKTQRLNGASITNKQSLNQHKITVLALWCFLDMITASFDSLDFQYFSPGCIKNKSEY